METQRLRELVSQFQSVGSLYFKSSVEILVTTTQPTDPPEIQNSINIPIQGEVEYWAADERYHFVSRAEADKLPSYNNAVAFDGEKFQILFGASKTLSVSSQDKAGILPALPNPFLELLQFRYPITDQNEGTWVRLKDVRNDQVPESFWNVNWTDVPAEQGGGAGPLKRAEFPGGAYQGQEYTHHVYVSGGVEARPVRINRVAAGGEVLTSVEISDWKPVGEGTSQTWWPHSIVLRAHESSGADGIRITYEITALSVNAAVSIVTFRISETARGQSAHRSERRCASS